MSFAAVQRILGVLLTAVPIMVWVERRGSALIQDRLGPNRVGPFGLIQPIADALKMLTKEDTRPTGADAVAAAGWWLRQLKNLPDTEEILGIAGDRRDPELGFVLARIEAALNGRPPSGTILSAEIAGPYGVFDILDLERGVTPADDKLPRPDTVFDNPWDPVRYTLTTPDGSVAPPAVLTPRGVFAVLWTIRADEVMDGWMAVEAEVDLIRLAGDPLGVGVDDDFHQHALPVASKRRPSTQLPCRSSASSSSTRQAR